MANLERIDLPRQEPLSGRVARQIIKYLFSDHVRAGDRLPSERSLAETLGVNRPAVREALRALQFLGLIEVRQTNGTYFRGAEQDLLFKLFEWSTVFSQPHGMDLLDARAELEVVVAGRAAERATDDVVTTLRDLLVIMRNADNAQFIEADLSFHTVLADASDNIVIRDMLRGSRSMIHDWIGRSVAGARSTTEAYLDHVRVFEAVADRDPDRARAAMLAHMTGAKRRLLAASPDLRHFLTDGTVPEAPLPS